LRRLLALGKDISRLNSIEWPERQKYNLLDYQGLLIDCRDPSRIFDNRSLTNVLIQFMQHGHSVFLILPEAKDIPVDGFNLSILPFLTLNLQLQKGKTLKKSLNSAFIAGYMTALNGHEFVISPRQTIQNLPYGWVWQITVSDNVDRAVCGQLGNAYILHPPASGRDPLAIKAILDFFKPDYEEPPPEERPDWLKEILSSMPGMAELESDSSKRRNEIARLQSELEMDDAKRLKLERWTEILWLDGIPLQNRVSDALGFLGIPNKSKDPTGHTQDLQGNCAGVPLLFEVTGSTGAIGVDKGRQLLQWIAECDDPTNTKGILIGNAFRKNCPEERPPSPNHKIFVKELEDLARRFHFGLLDVRDLFNLIVRKLHGEAIAIEHICGDLQGDGIIGFTKR
jgi:hypothetical protein